MLILGAHGYAHGLSLSSGMSVCFSLKCMLSMNTPTIIIMPAMSVIKLYLKAREQHNNVVHTCNPVAVKAEASRSQRLSGLPLIDEAMPVRGPVLESEVASV